MWLKRALIFSATLAVLLGLGTRLAPPQWFRKAGALDFILLIDYSGSYASALPVALKEAPRLIREILPGDRLSVLGVGPRVLDLFTGTVPGRSAIAEVQRQVRGLQVNTNGTELGQALIRARNVFESFADMPTRDGVRRRVMAIYSDCIDAPFVSGQALDVGAALLPGNVSILIVGMQGSHSDAVTRVLLGRDGNNDLHIAPPDEGPQATRAWLKCLRRAHPVKVPHVVAAALASSLLAAAVTVGVEAVSGGRSRLVVVSLRRRGEDDSQQEFALADGETVLIGGGDGPVDFRVPGEASCSICAQGRALSVSPGSGALVIRRGGRELPVHEPMRLFDRDTLMLGTREVEVTVQ